MDSTSGVGVIDKSVTILDCLASGPTTLAGLVHVSGLPRPTAHRLVSALEHHRLVRRDEHSRYVLGPRLAELAAASGADRFVAIVGPVLARLRDISGESAQAYRRRSDQMVCVAAAERATGLRDTVPVGTVRPLDQGVVADVIAAWDPARPHYRDVTLARVRRQGFAEGIDAEGLVAAVAAPVFSPGGAVQAVIALSGPSGRLGERPGHLHGPAVLSAAAMVTERMRRAAGGQPG